MKQAAAFMLVILAGTTVALGNSPVRNSRVFTPGEELRYAVRWQFFRLGTLTVRTECDSAAMTRHEATVAMEVESNPDLAFISIREVNESVMNMTTLFSTSYSGTHTNGDDSVNVSRTYDAAGGVMTYTVTEARTRRPVVADTVRPCRPFVEGPSLLFHARAIAGSLGVVNIPTCVGVDVSNTVLYFGGDIEDVEIDAVHNPVRTRYFTGHAEWTGAGAAGITGDFAGWMSDDEASVPIKAELTVLLGSITLELESWHRPGWVPPTGLTAAK